MNLSSRYLDANGTSSRAQLVTPLPNPNGNGTHSSRRRGSVSQSLHHPLSNSSFAQNMERYHRSSQSDYDLHHNSMGDINYGHHASIPSRSRPTTSNGNYRGYGTLDYSSYNYDGNRRRSLPKSFSDCDLCKRRVIDEEYQQHYNEQDDNWRLENSLDRRVTPSEPRAYREKIKERFRDRLSVRQIPDTDILPPSTTTVEYSTVLPRHQRNGSESNRSNGSIHHLPFEYIPNENPNNIRTNEHKRNLSQERMATGNHQAHTTNDENGTKNVTVKFYQHDDDDETKNRMDRSLHEAREVQEMSMRMNEQHFNRHQYHHQQQPRRFTGNNNGY
jgi:hypothetical protein